ncbi:MAG TPA: hypothetical protein VMV79_02315 [Alphaproteobacteria bacterium]|nr:hypothetical protein [Alphaproteobacteria bacterium]
MDKPNYKRFQALMNRDRPDNPVTEEEAAQAFHNLAEFVITLIEINDRVKLVPIKGEKNEGEFKK